jgi:fructose transport system substrate-binding protein
LCGHAVTGGAEDGGRTAMETLLQKCPDINLVYSINEPAAAGGYQGLKAAGKDDGSVLTVAIDGSCDGVKNVAAGTLGATSMQFPLKMAVMAMDALAQYAKDGSKPTVPADPGFIDTGATLITDKPVAGVPSTTSAEGLKICWG